MLFGGVDGGRLSREATAGGVAKLVLNLVQAKPAKRRRVKKVT